MKSLKGYKTVKKTDEIRLNCALAVLEAKRECIKAAIASCFKLMMSEDMACNNLEHAGAPYDLAEVNIMRIYRDNIQDLDQCFDHFVFNGPLTILYGDEDEVNFRRCQYGDTNAFRYAIVNHINSLKEIMTTLPYHLTELKSIVSQYIEELNNYFKLVRSVA